MHDVARWQTQQYERDVVGVLLSSGARMRRVMDDAWHEHSGGSPDGQANEKSARNAVTRLCAEECQSPWN